MDIYRHLSPSIRKENYRNRRLIAHRLDYRQRKRRESVSRYPSYHLQQEGRLSGSTAIMWGALLRQPRDDGYEG